MLPQLEKNREILLSMRDEALSLRGVARESQPSFLSLERVLDTLDVTQEVPRHTHLHLKGTPCVPPQLKNSPFSPPPLEMRVQVLALSGKESQHSRRTSRGGGLNVKLERNARGRATIPKNPMSQSNPDTPGSPALTRLSS